MNHDTLPDLTVNFMNTFKLFFSSQISLKTELLAGVTTFLTMIYSVFVNPTILHHAGMDQGAVFTATCLISAFACALTGLVANTPIGVALGMALNIYFAYSVIGGLGFDCQLQSYAHALRRYESSAKYLIFIRLFVNFSP